jgi:hypothetical protein
MKLLVTLLAATALLSAAETPLGKALTLKDQTPIASLTAKPDNFVGKTVQVKGKISEVCQLAGCWMKLADAEGRKVRIKVKDGEIVFPKTGAGKTAVAEGKYVKISLTKEQAIEQATEMAKEHGTKFDPKSITGPTTTYQISGTGAVILD